MAFTLTPVKGKGFVDREDLVEDMVNTLSNPKIRMGFALYGIRRVGKTSVFKEVQRRLEKKEGVIPIYFSVWNVAPRTIYSFTKGFSSQILDAYGTKIALKHKAFELLKSPRTLLRGIISELKLRTKAGEDIEFLLTFDEHEEDYDVLIKRVFNLPEQLAKETSTRCVLLIDEFPSIVDLKNGNGKIGEDILGVMRTIYEDQKNTVLCISGSIRKTMETAALSPTSPFYRQFLIKEVKPLKRGDVDKLIRNNLDNEISEDALDSIFNVTKGIPFYVQLIGRRIEAIKEGINKSNVERIIAELIDEEGDVIFKEEFQSMSPKEQEVIIAMAKENLHTPTEISKKIREYPPSVSRYIGYLREKGVIEKKGKGFYFINDPVFTMWVRRRYELF